MIDPGMAMFVVFLALFYLIVGKNSVRHDPARIVAMVILSALLSLIFATVTVWLRGALVARGWVLA
jgi:hypothetical protein